MNAKHPRDKLSSWPFCISEDLDNFYACGQLNLMEFNVKKCKLMHITKRIHQSYHEVFMSGHLCEPIENHKSKKVKPWSQDWLIAAGAYSGFCSMKRLGVFLLPLDGMLIHRRSLPSNLLGFPNNLPVPSYTPGLREALWELSVLPKNTTQCPRLGLEPGPLDPEMSALSCYIKTILLI